MKPFPSRAKQIAVKHIAVVQPGDVEPTLVYTGAWRDDPAQSASIILALHATLIGRQRGTATFSREESASVVA